MTVFRYYSLSKDEYPGKGRGEELSEGESYDDLVGRNFRQKLSNFWNFDLFDKEGNKWRSVEHYYQGHKMQIRTGETFDIISKATFDKTSLEMKKLTGKRLMPLTKEQSERWDAIRHQILRDALEIKFQNPVYMDILLKTRNATLSHVSRGQTGDAFGGGALLMEIRDKIMERP